MIMICDVYLKKLDCLANLLVTFQNVKTKDYVQAFESQSRIVQTIYQHIDIAERDFDPLLFQIIFTTFQFVSILVMNQT